MLFFGLRRKSALAGVTKQIKINSKTIINKKLDFEHYVHAGPAAVATFLYEAHLSSHKFL